MSPLDSWEAWILCQTFSDLKPLGRPCSKEENFFFLCSQLHEPDLNDRNIWTLHNMGMYRTYICMIWYFTLIYTHPCTNILYSSCEAQTHTYAKWVTHHKHIGLGKSPVTTQAPEGPWQSGSCHCSQKAALAVGNAAPTLCTWLSTTVPVPQSSSSSLKLHSFLPWWLESISGCSLFKRKCVCCFLWRGGCYWLKDEAEEASQWLK